MTMAEVDWNEKRDAADRAGSIRGNMERVAANIERLQGMVSALHTILSPVLRPESDSEMTAREPTKPIYQSELSEQLENYADELERIHRRIDDIMNRVNL